MALNPIETPTNTSFTFSQWIAKTNEIIEQLNTIGGVSNTYVQRIGDSMIGNLTISTTSTVIFANTNTAFSAPIQFDGQYMPFRNATGQTVMYISNTGSVFLTNDLEFVPNTTSGYTFKMDVNHANGELSFLYSSNTEILKLSSDSIILNRGTQVTGDFEVYKNTPSVILRRNGAGQAAKILGLSENSNTRWVFDLVNNETESGNNTGSNLSLSAFDDAGEYLSTPIYVSRATGTVTFTQSPKVGNDTVWHSGSFNPNTKLNLTGGILTGQVVYQNNTPFVFRAANSTVSSIIDFQNSSNTSQLRIFWDNSSDRAYFRRMSTDGASAEGEFYITSTQMNLSVPLTVNGVINSTSSGVFNTGTDSQVSFSSGSEPGIEIGRTGSSTTKTPFIDFHSSNNSPDYDSRIVGGGGSSGSSGQGTLTFIANGGVGFTGKITSANTPTPMDATSNTAIEIRNNGGTGNGNTAGVLFTCTGQYSTKLVLRADGFFGLGGVSASTWRWHVNTTTGDMTAAGNITANSDRRLKENIVPINDALETIHKLQGVKFNKIGQERTDIGFIAQDVEEVLAEVVSEGPDGYKTLAYSNMVALLVEGIKDLSKQVEDLKNEIKDLKGDS